VLLQNITLRVLSGRLSFMFYFSFFLFGMKILFFLVLKMSYTIDRIQFSS